MAERAGHYAMVVDSQSGEILGELDILKHASGTTSLVALFKRRGESVKARDIERLGPVSPMPGTVGYEYVIDPCPAMELPRWARRPGVSTYGVYIYPPPPDPMPRLVQIITEQYQPGKEGKQ